MCANSWSSTTLIRSSHQWRADTGRITFGRAKPQVNSRFGCSVDNRVIGRLIPRARATSAAAEAQRSSVNSSADDASHARCANPTIKKSTLQKIPAIQINATHRVMSGNDFGAPLPAGVDGDSPDGVTLVPDDLTVCGFRCSAAGAMTCTRHDGVIG